MQWLGLRFASAPPESKSSPVEVLSPAAIAPRLESALIPITNQLNLTYTTPDIPTSPTNPLVIESKDDCKEERNDKCNNDSKDDSDNKDPCPEVIDTTKIRKPPGEVGRPGRGGYNLQDALGWEVVSLQNMKVNTSLDDCVLVLND